MKLLQNTGDSTKLEGTNNYAQNKNFQKLPKIAEMEGTKNYAQNKTFENLQKNAKLEGIINTPSEGTNNYNYARNKNFQLPKLLAKQNFQKSPKKCQVGGDNKYPPSKAQQNDKARSYERVC
jgi:hypothetical protein